jgi:uncharacterized protein YbjT (DUF2867 family)
MVMPMESRLPTIAVLGASGLIGQAVAAQAARDGFPVVAIARRFTPAQREGFGATAVECPIVALEPAALTALFAEHAVDIVVNCIGVLQDGARGRTDDVHVGFVERLVSALGTAAPMLLVHISVPGEATNDRTAFSRSKRDAERCLAEASIASVVLRPGFVVAPAAYGGSALVRALAALPLALPAAEAARPFAATDVEDIGRTIAVVARRWQAGERNFRAVWDVMERRPSTVGGVVEAFRARFGGPPVWFALPSWLMTFGARMGDLAARLGWAPPIRTTALSEMRRGISGDPEPWIAACGIEPVSLKEVLHRLPATIQERWFARLYLAKPLIVGSLAAFWLVSGLLALTVAFAPASAILTGHGVPLRLAQFATLVTSLADIAIGAAIAWQSTCRAGLLAGIGLALAYMAGAAAIAPELWLDPLGSMVKTVPAVVLMVTALAILEDR